MFDVFISSPYSDKDDSVVHRRVASSRQYAARLAKDGVLAFSVIAYIHPMLEHDDLPTDYEFWKNMCLTSISVCKEVHVLCIDGWETSVGVQDEISVATSMGKVVKYVEVSTEPSGSVDFTILSNSR